MKSNIIARITLSATVLAGAWALTSCNDFLEVSPESAFNNEEIFSSETETKAMLATIYSKMTDTNLYGIAFPYTFNTNTDVELTTSGTQISTSANGDEANCFDMKALWPNLERTWNKAYEAINYCNDFIENMEGSSLFSREVGVTPTAMQQMYGEAKCLRALIYLDLIRTWGDVVYRTSPSKAGDNFYGEGVTDRTVILTNLINDLIDAEKYMLYASNLEEGVLRASREYCQALIGQLALYRGGWSLRPGAGVGEMKRENDYLEYYAIAREYLGKVISEQRHNIESQSYEQLWESECNWTVLKDGDVIFEVPMLKNQSSNIGYNVGVTIGFNTDSPHSYGQCTNRATLCGLYPFTFDMRDKRFYVTCCPISYDENLNQVVGLGNKNSGVSGWQIGKWNKLKMGGLTSTQGGTGINAIRMRFADVLLMYAEVVNEISGPIEDAKEALRRVRRRAFDPEDQAECVDAYVGAIAGKDEFFKAIMDERAWEFGGEGMRKYDLARWNKYGEVLINTYNKLIDWGQRANGLGVRGDVRDRIFWREVPNPEMSGKTMIEFAGLYEYGDDIPDHPVSEGWVNTWSYAVNWWTRNAETEMWEPLEDVKWSFRGYINYNNASSVTPDDPVRYLCPYPSQIITSHRGSIQQYYGYN